MSRRARRADARRPTGEPEAAAPRQPRRLHDGVRAWAGPVLVVVTGLAMVAWTWRTWPDPLVDYGREVYLAWQVSKGKTLYTDLAHFNGPLSAYVNGLVFRVFGPGILTLALANAVVAGACVAMLYALLVRVADWLAATLAALAFVTLFACARFVRLGNYNWLCPYSHELPHGVALGVASLWCLHRYQRTRSAVWMAATGGALGLAALTKAEVLLATGLAVATGVGLTLRRERPAARRLGRLAAAFAVGALVPLVATFVFFARHMPVAEVLRWPLGYWHAAARPEFVAMPMYRHGIGIDDMPGNIGKLAIALGWTTIAFAPGLVAAFALRRRREAAVPLAVLAVATGVVAWWLVPVEKWFEAARILPVLLTVIVIGSLVAWWRTGVDGEGADRLALRTALAVLALALLAKIVLNPRIPHYGFALAMPATLVSIAAAVTWAPELVSRAGGSGRAVRAVATALVLAMLAGDLIIARRMRARQTAVLGTGADAFYGDDRVAPLRAFLDEIHRRVGPGQTLVALPEGVLFNYLARRDSSVPYVQYSPLSVLMWGEEQLVADFTRSPPDFIALVHRDNAREGARHFGRDYAQALKRWVDANYRPVWRIGAPPLEDARFGIALLARVPPGSSPVSAPPATDTP